MTAFFFLLFYFVLKYCNCQYWARPKPGVSFIRVFYKDGGDLNSWIIPHDFPRPVSRELNKKWSSQDISHVLHGCQCHRQQLCLLSLNSSPMVVIPNNIRIAQMFGCSNWHLNPFDLMLINFDNLKETLSIYISHILTVNSI